MAEVWWGPELDAAWWRLNHLFWHYDKLLDDDLLQDLVRAIQEIRDYHLQTDEFSRADYEQAVTNAVTNADRLEKQCQTEAEQRSKQDSNSLPADLQKQELTPEDLEYIQQQLQLLAQIEPVVGRVDMYFETGTEGAYWSLEEINGLSGYEGLRIIGGGDRLVVYNDDGSVYLDQILIEDHDVGWHPYNSDYPYGLGQQTCAGLWVHWIPKGYSAEEWAEIYVGARGKRAELYQLSAP